jgi:hypothetical protein
MKATLFKPEDFRVSGLEPADVRNPHWAEYL